MSEGPPRDKLMMQRVLASVPFRLLVAAFFLGYHLLSVAWFAHGRYEVPLNAEPHAAPSYEDPDNTGNGQLRHASRLAYARWDAGQYIMLTLEGYDHCPPGKLDRQALATLPKACKLAFYPGYPILARVLIAVTKLPADYALFAISLLCSFLFLFLWTDPDVQQRLGTAETYISLLVFNAFPTSCYLVFVMTEPCVLLFTLGAFLALLKKHYYTGAVLAGAASGMRIGGAATSIAYAIAILTATWAERSAGWALVARRIANVPLAGWGGLAIMAYHWRRFGDVFAYVHAHGAAYHVTGSLHDVLFPKVDWIMHSLDGPTHDLMWGVAIALWFLLAHRETLRRFLPAEQVFCYALVFVSLGLAYAGSIEVYMRGFARYALVAIPIFYAIGTFLRSRQIVLVVWLMVCMWHYREVDVCYYLGDVGMGGLRKCHMTQWSSW